MDFELSGLTLGDKVEVGAGFLEEEDRTKTPVVWLLYSTQDDPDGLDTAQPRLTMTPGQASRLAAALQLAVETLKGGAGQAPISGPKH